MWRTDSLRIFWYIAFAIASLLAAGGAFAQDTSLVADAVTVQSQSRITASGNVEISAGDIRLQASRISYDSSTDTLTIEGPVILTQGNDTVFFASSAELGADLQNGILKGARLVLNKHLQIAAAEINRVGGRYTQLYRSVASSCRIRTNGEKPLWEIRTSKIIHDQKTGQLYFENAQLRIAGVPVFYLPRMRLPDPTVKRYTGFLVPSLRSTSQLGLGIKIPYFITLGDSADITLTPYLSAFTNTLEARYRQAFARGQLQFDSALTIDKLRPGSPRAYLFGRGNFDLARGFGLSFDFELTSDPAYLLDYGYSGKDRLDSQIEISRTRAQDYFKAGVIGLQTLRGSELAIDDQLPNFQGSVFYEKRFFPEKLGGQGSWSLRAESHSRDSSLDQLGRDVDHIGGRLNWGRSATLTNGMVARVSGVLSGDFYQIHQDSTYASTLAFATPALAGDLRWPLTKQARDGAALVFEPVINLAWTHNIGANVPNEDSTLVEFDEGNLFSISRFPGQDRFEHGLRTTVGASWTRYDPRGWSLGLVLGRVYRDSDPAQFSQASGLAGTRSDWLAAANLKIDSRFALSARALIGDDLSVTKAETGLRWNTDRLALATTYSWIIADATENRPNLASQMTMDASYRIRDYWTASLEYLYDFDADKATRAALGLNFTNECIKVDLSLSRRFTSSTSVTPTTDIGLSVSLLGFGSDGSGKNSSCSGL
jgi:LPS-assembly protein